MFRHATGAGQDHSALPRGFRNATDHHEPHSFPQQTIFCIKNDGYYAIDGRSRAVEL